MFQFPHLPPSPYYRPCGPSDEGDRLLLLPGFPIRVPAGQSLFTALRSFSQSTAPFFGSWRQGIHHTPLVACYICLGIGKTEVLLIHFLRFSPHPAEPFPRDAARTLRTLQGCSSQTGGTSDNNRRSAPPLSTRLPPPPARRFRSPRLAKARPPVRPIAACRPSNHVTIATILQADLDYNPERYHSSPIEAAHNSWPSRKRPGSPERPTLTGPLNTNLTRRPTGSV